MRVLTDPRGRVQTGIVAFIEDLLRRDVAEFGLVTLIEPDALAYALVRLGESFLYADVLAARKPDVATANRLQQALIEGVLSQASRPQASRPQASRLQHPGRSVRIAVKLPMDHPAPRGPGRDRLRGGS